MSKWFQIIILMLLGIISVGVVSAGTQLNVPSCWVLSITGAPIDDNCDGIVNSAANSLTLNGINSSSFTLLSVHQADNTSIWNELALKMYITDQRYNDTALIKSINTTLSSYITQINLTLNNEISGRINNDSYLQGQINAIALSNSSANARIDELNLTKLDKTDQRYNDTALINNVNATVNNLLSSNTTTNARIDSVNTTVNNLLSSNTTTNTRIDELNTSSKAFMFLTGSNSNITLIKFNTSSTTAAFPLGQLGWDTTENSLSIGYPYGATLQVGKETYKEVTNLDSVTITPGTPVSITSASGNREAVKITNISNPMSAYAYIGLATTTIAPNQKGLITVVGDVHDLNTNSFTEGAPVYVAANGSLTQTFPTEPNYIINVGLVTVKSATVGIIAVTNLVMPRLTDLSDIDGIPVNVTGQILAWNESAQVWDAYININDYLTYAAARGIYYNKTEVDNLIAGISSLTNYYNKSQTYNKSEVYNKSESDANYYPMASGLNLSNIILDEISARKSNDSALANNISSLNLTKLDIIDQRYNDTAAIIAEYNGRLSNDSYLQNQINNLSLNGSSNLALINALNNSKYDKTGGLISGDVTISGNLNVIGTYANLTVTNSILNGTFNPSLNNTFDIGSTAKYWNEGYFDTLYGKLNYSYIQNVPDFALNSKVDSVNSTVVALVSSNTTTNSRIDSVNSTVVALVSSNTTTNSRIDSVNSTVVALVSSNTTTNSRIDSVNSTVVALVSSNTTTNSRIDSLNLTKLNVTDQRYNDTALINAVNTTTNIQSLGFYNSTFLDPYLSSGGIRIYWFTNKTNVAGYKNMTLTLPTNPMATLTIPISTSTISLGTFITPYSANQTVFTAGIRNIYVNAYVEDAGRTVQLQTIVSRCINYNATTDTCGSIIGFANSTQSVILTTAAAEYLMTYYVNSTYILNSTDRFIVNVTATKTAGGNTNMKFIVDDNSFSRIEVPSPVGVTDLTALQAADAAETAARIANDSTLNTKINQVNTSSNIMPLYGNVQYDPQGLSLYGGEYSNTNLNLYSTLSFVDGTRNFSITPVGWYDYYIGGIQYNVTTQKSMIISNTTGVHIIYIASNGSLVETNTLTEDILCKNAIVAIVIYDAIKGISLSFADERHGHYFECQVHLELHEHLGTQYESGLALTNVTVGGSQNVNQSAQLGVTAGQITDEDLHHDIAAYLNPARMRVYYSWGTAGNWSYKYDIFPMVYSGDGSGYVGANGRLGANTGLTTFTQCGNNQFILTHIFANNAVNTTQDVFAVTGTTCYSTAALATTGAPSELATIMSTNAFNAEIKPLYTLLLLTTTTAQNTPHGAWAAPSTGGSFIDYRNTAVSGVSGISQSGTVTLVDSGTGLTGGPITGAGTLSIDNTYIQQFNDTVAITNAINSINTTTNIQSLGFNTTIQLDARYGELATANTWTGYNTFNPTTNTTFYGTELHYGDAYYLGNIVFTNTSTMNVSSGIKLKNLANQTIGTWGDNLGNANLWTNGWINTTGLIYENGTSLNTKYNDTALINTINNLSITQIANNIGNYSADRNSIISNLSLLNSTKISIGADINWTTLTNYPVACSANNFITQIGDTITCTSVQATIVSLAVGGNLTVNGYINDSKGSLERYNDTALINTINNLSITQIASNIGNYSADSAGLKANITNVNATANTKALPGNCPAGQVVQNTTTTGVQCVVAATVNNITGIGVANTIAKWSNNSNLATSTITDDGSTVNITANLTIGTGAQYLDIYNNGANVIFNNTLAALFSSDVCYGSNCLSNILSITTIAGNIGNWTADKPSYATNTYVGNIVTNVTTLQGQMAGLNNLSITTIAGNIGNWTADKASVVANLTQINTTAINALPKAGGTMTGNITVGTNVGWYVNSTVYSSWNGTCWVVRNGATYSYVC